MKPQEPVKTRKNYTLEYRQSCVERAQRIGNVAACARELNLSYGVLLSWVYKSQGGAMAPKKPTNISEDSKEM